MRAKGSGRTCSRSGGSSGGRSSGRRGLGRRRGLARSTVTRVGRGRFRIGRDLTLDEFLDEFRIVYFHNNVVGHRVRCNAGPCSVKSGEK